MSDARRLDIVRAVEVWLVFSFDSFVPVILVKISIFDEINRLRCSHRLSTMDGLRRLARRRQSELLALLAQDSLTGEFDSIALDRQHLDKNLVALAQLVFDFLDAMFRDLGDVQEAVGSGEDFDERAKLSQPNHLAEIGLAHLRGGGQVGNHLNGAGETVRIA